MLKGFKFVAGLALLPVCASAVPTLFRVVRGSGGADLFWAAFIGGAASWVSIFLLLPKPMWVYVFGHELTHAIWAWMFAGQVKRFKVTSRGGEVAVTRTNFLIMLAPYFFPVYAALVVGVFLAGNWIWDWSRLRVWFHLALGASYAFHVTLTAHILQARQSDITQQGRLFSAAVIFLGNITVLLAGIPLLAGQPRLLTAFEWWFRATVRLLEWRP